MKINTNKNIKFVKDRPFNDIRYSVSFAKIKAHGWKPFRNFNKEILIMIDWYKKNINLFKKIK